MTEELKPCDLEALRTFEFDRVLSESTSTARDREMLIADTTTGSAYLLGKLHDRPAIIHVQRTSLDSTSAPGLVKDGLESLDVFLDNRPVSPSWL